MLTFSGQGVLYNIYTVFTHPILYWYKLLLPKPSPHITRKPCWNQLGAECEKSVRKVNTNSPTPWPPQSLWSSASFICGCFSFHVCRKSSFFHLRLWCAFQNCASRQWYHIAIQMKLQAPEFSSFFFGVVPRKLSFDKSLIQLILSAFGHNCHDLMSPNKPNIEEKLL